MKLRPYQRESIDAIRSVWDTGIPNAMITMATGLGKTVTFSHVIREVLAEHGSSAKALVLAHRTELVAQARDKYMAVDPDELVGIFQGTRKETWARVICASVQSCYPDKVDEAGNVTQRGRVHDLPLADIKVVVIDECHHTPARSYLELLDAIEAASPGCRFLGVTATPYRADGTGLGVRWDTAVERMKAPPGGWSTDDPRRPTGVLCYRMGIQRGIEEGWLVPISSRSRRIVVDAVDLSKVQVSRATKDYVESSLASVMDTDGVRHAIVDSWLDHAGPGTEWAPERGRQTVFFCAGVQAAQHLADAFNERGIAAGWLSGSTAKDERRGVIQAFDRGDITVICNCQVLTEGWDSPKTACVGIARPTKSLSSFVQMLGRGLRLAGLNIEQSRANGKADCLLLDFAGASAEGVMGQADLSRADRAPGIDLTDAEQEEEALAEAPPEQIEALINIDVSEPPRQSMVRGVSEYAIDVFAEGRIHWGLINGARIGMVRQGLAVVIYPAGQQFNAIAIRQDSHFRVLAAGGEQDVLKRAAQFALLHGTDAYLKPGPWFTNKPASAAQIGMIQRLHGGLEKIGLAKGVPPKTPSMAQAMLWISYLAARTAFATKVATQVDDLFPAAERVEGLARWRKKETPPSREARRGFRRKEP